MRRVVRSEPPYRHSPERVEWMEQVAFGRRPDPERDDWPERDYGDDPEDRERCPVRGEDEDGRWDPDRYSGGY